MAAPPSVIRRALATETCDDMPTLAAEAARVAQMIAELPPNTSVHGWPRGTTAAQIEADMRRAVVEAKDADDACVPVQPHCQAAWYARRKAQSREAAKKDQPAPDSISYASRCGVMFCGEPGAGKTALVMCIVKNEAAGARHVPTVGVDFYSIRLCSASGADVDQTEDADSLRLAIWDTGGANHVNVIKHYMSGCRVGIVVCDVCDANALAHLTRWVEQWRECEPRAAIFCVGSKRDLAAKRQISATQFSARATSLGVRYIETSAKTGAGVADVLDAIARVFAFARAPSTFAFERTTDVDGADEVEAASAPAQLRTTAAPAIIVTPSSSSSLSSTAAAAATPRRYEPTSILITGGCGFIASHVIARVADAFPGALIVNLDKMTYCASRENVRAVEERLGARYAFVQGSICSADLVAHVLRTYDVDTVMHFAAESHVDASFGNSLLFTENNVVGTHTLLECARVHGRVKRFIHVSTDEVYGETPNGSVTEQTATRPTNPYAASKAAAEQYVEAYHRSYGLPTIMTRGNNVYGAHQFIEKAIPKFIVRLARGLPCCLHGSGTSVRNFLHVDDVADAFVTILSNGAVGETYNIGTEVGISIRSLAERLVRLAHPGISDSDIETHITCVEDRAFNDQRYDISNSKIYALGWTPRVSFDEGLRRTHDWYRQKGIEKRWDQTSVENALRPHPGRG